ncbi:uncharacterized protein LOC131011934 isoform X2 [Salvia miltiorrhiza]|uniref:uncharacterized protein LOC131011934 isoform X2 n=1 Tax=Salvia miltiorrhiza TaxID=226208 RepID=UPI0025AD97F6|nr:uncharacterized protein LOC131011934 isoform X2 [Salvia miltiorrhiza]
MYAKASVTERESQLFKKAMLLISSIYGVKFAIVDGVPHIAQTDINIESSILVNKEAFQVAGTSGTSDGFREMGEGISIAHSVGVGNFQKDIVSDDLYPMDMGDGGVRSTNNEKANQCTDAMDRVDDMVDVPNVIDMANQCTDAMDRVDDMVDVPNVIDMKNEKNVMGNVPANVQDIEGAHTKVRCKGVVIAEVDNEDRERSPGVIKYTYDRRSKKV